MFGFGKLKFKGVDKAYIRDEEHIADYNSAEAIGRLRFGKLCLYYRDLGVKYYVPYEYIERAYGKISECHPDDSPAYYYYRLILVHDGKEFANLIFDNEGDIPAILDRLEKLNPDMKRGYSAPDAAKAKRSFWRNQ